MSRYFLVHSLDGTEDTYTDGDLPLSIGSGNSAHLLIAGGKHVEAYIGESQGHLFLQPATTEAPVVFHNDEAVDKSVWIKSGDVLRIGKNVITYTVSGDRVTLAVREQDTSVEARPLDPPGAPPNSRPLPRTHKSRDQERLWWKRRHL